MTKHSIVFLATPQFAVPTLAALIESQDYEVQAVITQPDRPAGRGRKMSPPPVKAKAEAHSIPVLQFASIKGLTYNEKEKKYEGSIAELSTALNELGKIDAVITVAYGNVIPKALFQGPTYGSINIHPSLLPRWRGAAPLQYAIFSGDEETGIALMEVDEGLDTGPVYFVEHTKIAKGETLGELHDRLAIRGAELLIEKLPEIFSGQLKPVPQNEDQATYAEKWQTSDAEIDWNESGEETSRRIRASSPTPGARTSYEGERVKIFAATLVDASRYPKGKAGEIVFESKNELVVATGKGSYISIDELQLPGKKRLGISQILQTDKLKQGRQFN